MELMSDILPPSGSSVKTDDASSLSDSRGVGVDDPNAMVARNIRRYREERKLSLGELARRAHLSKQTLSKIEIGSGNPTIGTMAAIADALGLSIRSLMTEWGSPVRISRASVAVWNGGDQGVKERMLDTIYGSGDVRSWLLRFRMTAAGPTTAGVANSSVVRYEPSATGTLHHCYLISGRARVGPAGETLDLEAGDFVRFPGDTKHVFQSLSGDALLHIVTTVPGVPQFQPVRDGSP